MNVGLVQVGDAERYCTAHEDLDLVLFVLVKLHNRPPPLFLPDLVLSEPMRFLRLLDRRRLPRQSFRTCFLRKFLHLQRPD
jgi:hypothetical protein